MYKLDEKSKKPLYIQLYEQIRSEVEQGRLSEGSLLMSGRRLAQELGVSRNTVALAYEKLLSEGVIVSSPRRGYYVETGAAKPKDKHAAEKKKIIYDLRADAGCTEMFPLGKWRLCLSRALSDAELLSKPSEIFGDAVLRKELSNFLYRCRDIKCGADEVFVFAGEDACFSAALDIAGGSDCVYITAFEEWENIVENSGEKWIIEDSRGFLYDGRGAASVPQNGRTIYIGVLSDIMLPGLGMAYMVLPEGAAAKMTERTANISGALQRAAALFIGDKNFGKYLRKMSANEREKTEEFAKLLEARKISSVKKGRHIYLKSCGDIVRTAETVGLCMDSAEKGTRLSCSGIKRENVKNAADALADVIIKTEKLALS